MFTQDNSVYFGSDEDVFESPLPLTGYASLRAAGGRACVGSRGGIVVPVVASHTCAGSPREREGAFGHVLVTAEIH